MITPITETTTENIEVPENFCPLTTVEFFTTETQWHRGAQRKTKRVFSVFSVSL